jgi:hypothetical protein
MTAGECKAALVQAHRSGDMHRAAELSQVKEQIKKDSRRYCHCGRAKSGAALECQLCSLATRRRSNRIGTMNCPDCGGHKASHAKRCLKCAKLIGATGGRPRKSSH